MLLQPLAARAASRRPASSARRAKRRAGDGGMAKGTSRSRGSFGPWPGKEKGRPRGRPEWAGLGATSVRDVVGRALVAHRLVDLVPFLLGRAVGIVLQGLLILELHHEDMGPLDRG